jgi:hypothetical protein
MGAGEEWMHDPLIKQAMADAKPGGVNWPIAIVIGVVVLGLGVLTTDVGDGVAW